MEKYPAKQHARNIAKELQVKDGLIYLEGTPTVLFEDSDEAVKFRQRRYFLYLSGVSDIPDCYLTYSIQDDKLTLYIPPFNPSQVLWSGLPPSLEDCIYKYDVDEVLHSTAVAEDILSYHLTAPHSPLYILHTQQSLIPTTVPENSINNRHLQPAIDNARVYKDDYEIALLRKANAISAAAHRAVMAAVRTAKNEAELEGIFLQQCVSRQAKTQAYDPIVGSGRNAATLHYVKNDEPLKGRQLVLLDAGAEWEGYASDVTRTFPISGKWSREAKDVYTIVETMQRECIKRTVKGVDWRDTHTLAHRIAVKGLMQLGILHNGTEEEIFRAGTSKAFFPHGLGHFLGLDTHDVEGTPDVNWKVEGTGSSMAPALPTPRVGRGLYKTAVRRTLQPRMVITVEPGIYFCEFIILPYLAHPIHGRYINKKVLDRYWDVGGVRIEDDILILENGNENLTMAPTGTEMLALISQSQGLNQNQGQSQSQCNGYDW